MGVEATYCQYCGLPVNHEHYIPKDGKSNLFYIYRGGDNEEIKPLIDFKECHEWLKDVLGLPFDNQGKIVEGKIYDGYIEMQNGESASVWESRDEYVAVHRACWKIAGSPEFYKYSNSIFSYCIIDNLIRPFGKGQLFDFKGLVDAGYGWMLIDPETADGEKNRQRILGLLEKIKLYEEAGVYYKEKNYDKAVQIFEKLDDNGLIKNISATYIEKNEYEKGYNLLVNYFKNTNQFDEKLTMDFIEICVELKKTEGKEIDAIIDNCIINMEKDIAYRNDDLLNYLIYLLTDMQKYEKIFKVMDIFKNIGYVFESQTVSHYTYAVRRAKDEKIIKKFLNEFMIEYENVIVTDLDILPHIVIMYKIIGDKENMLKYLKLQKDIDPNFNSIKTDKDFQDYWDDDDFLKLFE